MSDTTAFIIGPGEVGRRLGAALEASGERVRHVTRTDGWDEALAASGALRVLAMREDDLPPALERFADGDRADLVLVQNGFLEERLGDLSGPTRGLIWFRSKGEVFEPLAPSLFHGRHAERLASALRAARIPAETIHDGPWFAREMILKGAWNCVVGLPLAVHGVTLGQYLETRRDEAAALVGEAARVASAEHGVDVRGEEALGRLLATTAPLATAGGSTSALSWRGGAVAAMGDRHGIDTPAHDVLLAAARD